MKKKLALLIFLILFISLYSVSIYDIQYTQNSVDGTYPSPYANQMVTTGGIVSATNYHNGRFFISSSTGGAWNGLFVYSNDYAVAVGDSVLITAQVVEYNGFTELSYLQSLSIISHNNPLPNPISITTEQLNSEEAYESVLVEIDNPTAISIYDDYNNWLALNSSVPCNVDDEFFSDSDIQDILPLIQGYNFEKIKGIVNYSYSKYRLNPRDLSDFYSNDNGSIISIPQINGIQNDEIDISIMISFLGDNKNITAYDFEIVYDANILSYINFDDDGTLSQNGTITAEEISSGVLSLSFNGNFSFIGTQILIKLSFATLGSGVFTPSFNSFNINNISDDWIVTHLINIIPTGNSIGDTITVIQRPLQNIPVMVTPNDSFTIECIAPIETSNWDAQLIYKDINVPLFISDTYYNNNLNRWFLTANIPQVNLFELYDLKVSASNEIEDVTCHSVYVIDHFKDDYSFIQITDTHLPTHIFSTEEASLTDTTSMIDLREVIKDINLIHPAFVLLTGDLVNEGELEDYQNRRYFTKAQRILKELDIPVFLTSGNHDLGGWNDTAPPAGTSRRNWWKFFGWNYLENPTNEYSYYTQNYSFDYGVTHFIGMEAYINYDSFMYYIYGDDSFTNLQMNWLNNDLEESSESLSNVLFYHYDFSDQINLQNMGIDMTLWGHTHQNEGNINQSPYNLCTASVCDGNRAYRVIKVNNGILNPQNTLYAGNNGENLSITFSPSNTGIADSVYATVMNQQNIGFTDAMIKFVMPLNFDDFSVENGNITQITECENHKICYVSFDISANSNIEISCKGQASSISENELNEVIKLSNYPNPMKNKTTISFELTSKNKKRIKIEIYNIKGEKVKTLTPIINGITGYATWNVLNENNKKVSSGLYFYRIVADNKVLISKKILVIK